MIFNHKYMNNYLQMTQKELDINTVIDLLIKRQIWKIQFLHYDYQLD
jgi:hypothetical protein